MNIYTPEFHSTKVLPYVYRLDNPVTGEFYIGYRSANVVPSDQDLPQYKTSKDKVSDNFDEFNWYIVAEFFDSNDAYDFEQLLIFEDWKNPLLINESCYHNKARFKRTPESILKQKGRLPSNIGALGKANNIVKETCKILNISPNCNKMKKGEYRKFVSFLGIFLIMFNTNEERVEFLENNKNFVAGYNNPEANAKISKTLTGIKKKTRTDAHKENHRKSYPKFNKNKGVSKSVEHKQKLSISNTGKKQSYETIEKRKINSLKDNGFHNSSKFDSINIELIIDLIVNKFYTLKAVSEELNISRYVIGRRLMEDNIDISVFIKRNQSMVISKALTGLVRK